MPSARLRPAAAAPREAVARTLDARARASSGIACRGAASRWRQERRAGRAGGPQGGGRSSGRLGRRHSEQPAISSDTGRATCDRDDSSSTVLPLPVGPADTTIEPVAAVRLVEALRLHAVERGEREERARRRRERARHRRGGGRRRSASIARWTARGRCRCRKKTHACDGAAAAREQLVVSRNAPPRLRPPSASEKPSRRANAPPRPRAARRAGRHGHAAASMRNLHRHLSLVAGRVDRTARSATARPPSSASSASGRPGRPTTAASAR